LVVPPIHKMWLGVMSYDWFSGLLGSLLGAMVGAFVLWLTRILGTLGFGRVAMGLGDAHLMFGVGAVIGGAGATVAFFLAPFCGILVGIYMLITRRGRELPLVPYLSLGSIVVMVCYCPMMAHLRPGMIGLMMALAQLLGLDSGTT